MELSRFYHGSFRIVMEPTATCCSSNRSIRLPRSRLRDNLRGESALKRNFRLARDSPAKSDPSVCGGGALCVSAILRRRLLPRRLSVDSVQAPVLDCVHEYQECVGGASRYFRSRRPRWLAPRENAWPCSTTLIARENWE